MARAEIEVRVADLPEIKARLDQLSRELIDAQDALNRVRALADDYERAADEAAEASVGLPADTVEYYRRVTVAGFAAADRIRAAIEGES